MRANTTLAKDMPQPFRTRARLSMTLRVCASIPSGIGTESSSGSVASWPVTKTKGPASTAWLYGVTGLGASFSRWKIGSMTNFPRRTLFGLLFGACRRRPLSGVSLNELTRAVGFGIGEKLLRRSGFDDTSTVEKQHPRSGFARKTHF